MMGTSGSVSRVSVSDDDVTSGGLVEVEGEKRRIPVEITSRRRLRKSISSCCKDRKWRQTKSVIVL